MGFDMKRQADSHPVNPPDIGTDRRHNFGWCPPRALGRAGNTNGDDRGDFRQQFTRTMTNRRKLFDHGAIGDT